MQDKENPQKFMLIEIYRDDQAPGKHKVRNAHVRGLHLLSALLSTS